MDMTVCMGGGAGGWARVEWAHGLALRLSIGGFLSIVAFSSICCAGSKSMAQIQK